MRTVEEVKKDQDQAIFDLGFHVAKVEQHMRGVDACKAKVFELAKEAEAIATPKENLPHETVMGESK